MGSRYKIRYTVLTEEERLSMNREDVEKLTLDDPEPGGLRTHVKGLPPHLQASISGGQRRFQFTLKRTGDVQPYLQNPPCGTKEDALRALKKLLNWDPV